MMLLRNIALLIAAGYLVQCTLSHLGQTGSAGARTKIRDAGRREMKAPPKDWDMVDERGDESFPASDPPGNY
ncbi:hypothetical protein [Natronohydrobacter thiooxidans]|uniref:hypothetical protein n=1 Tax=Natronohydrobacter thiooxidans TaxID=87172 RepID=UPI000AEFF3CF